MQIFSHGVSSGVRVRGGVAEGPSSGDKAIFGAERITPTFHAKTIFFV
jgi:hypothetical protein